MVCTTALALSLLLAPSPTTPPVTYVLDYGQGHLGSESYLQHVAAAPPQVLHLGKDVPLTHNWGPIVALGGENQAYARDDDIRRLTPAELTQRIADLKTMIDGLHRGGVTNVMPYICLMTIGGDETKRTGFWEFYDHWSEYAQFGLGPRPETDPFTWLQRKADGTPLKFYGYAGPFYPPYKPNQRYAASINNPDWVRWQETVVRLLAQVGYDGCFIDNGGSERSEDPLSQALFTAELQQRYPPAQARELFGVESLADVHLTYQRGSLAGYESARFWAAAKRRHYQRLEAVASKALGRRFKLFPNGGRLEDIKASFPDCDWVMYELSMGDYGTNTGRAKRQIVEDIAIRHTNRHLLDYLYPQAVGGRVRAMLLTRAGYPRSNPEWEMNATAAELGLAEAAAFSGGGGYLLRPRWDEYGAVLRRYRGFCEAHPELYAGLLPTARVGILTFAEQAWYGHREHLQVAEAALDALAAIGVPAMPVTEEDCTPEGLAAYDLVLAPELGYLSSARMEVLRTVAGAGKPVLLVGHAAAHDELCRELPADQQLAAGGGLQQLASVEELPSAIPVAQLRLLVAPDDSEVRCMAYRAPDGRYVVHLVNYAVDLGAGADRLETANGLSLQLPSEWQSKQATVWSPSWQSSRPVKIGADGKLPLPELRIYQVVELRP